MMLFKSSLLAFSLFFLSSFRAFSQSKDDCKYLTVIAYLRTNTAINERIKMFFPTMLKRKDRFIDFNLSDRIDFLGISDFKEKLQSKHFGIKEELLNDAKLYYKEYYFESFKSDFLRRLMPRNGSKLFLTFSRPIGDYLVAELSNFDPEDNKKVKFGKGMQFFFKFDQLGIIEDVLYAGSAYN